MATHALILRENGVVCCEEEVEEKFQQTRILVLFLISLGLPDM